jgi:hypothetical protein
MERVRKTNQTKYWKARAEERRYLASRQSAEPWTPEQEAELSAFCAAEGIRRSQNGDSFYFSAQGKQYRISNHSEEISNAWGKNLNGKRIRGSYHPRKSRTVSILAPKSRVKEIYSRIQGN